VPASHVAPFDSLTKRPLESMCTRAVTGSGEKRPGSSLPPSVVATAATSIRKLMHAGEKRAHLWENSRTLHAGIKALGFTLGTETPQSAIIAVIMPDLERGAAMWEALLHEGLYVNLARPPATPAGMTLLRCSLCAEHTAEQVERIIGMFERAGKAAGII
jgi:glycine C-acetyltransferase/8-amino-7-oxononanoate synthase